MLDKIYFELSPNGQCLCHTKLNFDVRASNTSTWPSNRPGYADVAPSYTWVYSNDEKFPINVLAHFDENGEQVIIPYAP